MILSLKKDRIIALIGWRFSRLNIVFGKLAYTNMQHVLALCSISISSLSTVLRNQNEQELYWGQ